MTRRSRRAFLAGGASGLAALAGCANLPVVGDSGPSVSYDGERLLALADPDAVDVSATYPAPVPNDLAETHFERARTLLDGVPSDPSFPNGAVTQRLADERERVADALSEPPGDVATLDALDDWRYDRGDAAEIRAMYDAANGDASATELHERRDAVRSDLAAFRESWTYRAASPVAAFAVHRRLESLAGACRRYVEPNRRFPSDPQSAVFEVGELAADVERARATIADAAGLRAAYVDDGMASYWSDVGTAANRLEAAIHPTRRPVEPYVERDARPSDFQRDVEDTPAERLFEEVWRAARSGADWVQNALDRGDYASAVAAGGRTLVALVAMSTVVDAIRDGEYGVPASTDAVVDAREQAVAAVDEASAVEPRPVADVLAVRARSALHYGDEALAVDPQYEADDPPSQHDVVEAVGQYAAAEHFADAVPAVAERVTGELRGGE